MSQELSPDSAVNGLTSIVLGIAPQERIDAVMHALGMNSCETCHESFDVGPLRALLADCWEREFSEPVPIRSLREIVARIPRTVFKEHFVDLSEGEQASAVGEAILRILRVLRHGANEFARHQLTLIGDRPTRRPRSDIANGPDGEVVTDLRVPVGPPRPASLS